MKIALMHYSAPPVVGGVESVLGYHARLMADAGHEARVIAGRGESFDSRIPFIQIPLIDSKHPEVLAVKGELDIGRVPPLFSEISRRLVDQLAKVLVDVDLLVAHNVCSLHKNLALTAALKQLFNRGIYSKLILWHHDLAWTTPRYQAELHAGFPWNLLLEDWPGANQVVVSEQRRCELAELLHVQPDRIVVVPNGIDIDRLLKLESQTREFVDRLDLLSAAPLLLLPVRITPRKNIELALRVVAAFWKTFPQVKLLVSGPPGPHNPANWDYFQNLLRMRDDLHLKEVFHFLAELTEEYLPEAVIADFYHFSDALFLPSREEGFGIPILEATVAGIPVFCSDIPSLRELAGDYGHYFSPDGDPVDIAELMADYLNANPIYRQRARVRANYTWERVYNERISPLLVPG
jgi:glycosyltransferase involved in cell wall biosynthesis